MNCSVEFLLYKYVLYLFNFLCSRFDEIPDIDVDGRKIKQCLFRNGSRTVVVVTRNTEFRRRLLIRLVTVPLPGTACLFVGL